MKLAPELEIKKLYRSWVTNRLIRYFRANKDIIKRSVNLDTDEVLFFESLSRDYNFDKYIYVTHLSDLQLETFLDGKRFVKSNVFNEFINGEGMVNSRNVNEYVMVIHMNGMYWSIRRGNSHKGYAGIGGIFIQVKDEGPFIIETFDNYLQYEFEYPIED
jgi:hypothetical protein